MNIKHLQVYKSDLEVLFLYAYVEAIPFGCPDINGQEQATAPTSETQPIILNKTNNLV